MPYQSGTPAWRERKRYAKMDKYISVIRRLDRFTVKLGRLHKKDDDDFKQKGVDVEFALDLSNLCLTGMIDKAIIISGDSDFVPAVERANDLGVDTENVYHAIEFSYHLRDVCRYSREIDDQLIEESLLDEKRT